MFPKGADADSPVIQSQLAAGRYAVNITTDPNFPDRTLYLPTGVPAGERIPILAWQNGMCYLYGRMYQAFLSEIAAHGYLVIAPGPPNNMTGRSNAGWQTASIAQAKQWDRAPFTVAADKVAVAGHSCGGGETTRNLAADTAGVIRTGILMNSPGGSSAFSRVSAPMLWVHGGKVDTEAAMDANFAWVQQNRPDLAVVEVGLQTGHLGSFWSARGGIYAETVVHWLDWLLKDDTAAGAWFTGGVQSAAAQRGWKFQANAIA